MNEDRVPLPPARHDHPREVPRAATPACASARPRPSRSSTARRASSRRAASAAATASPSAARTPSRCSAASRRPRNSSPATLPVAAIVAPSYPAEFTECDTAGLVGALRDLGFVRRPRGQLRRRPRRRRVRAPAGAATTGATSPPSCPAVVSYVRKYHPDILDRLAPIVSPMLAIARVLHKKFGPGAQDRVHRALHRQEGRSSLRAVRGRGRRGAHLRRAPRHARRARREPQGRDESRPTTSTRPTAVWAPSSPSAAGCCRRPTSTRTC